MIVAVDKQDLDSRSLELAYRYARCRCLMAAERRSGSMPRGCDPLEEALSALKDAQKVRPSLAGATKSVDGAREALDAMVGRVETCLARVESLIASAETRLRLTAESSLSCARPQDCPVEASA